MVGEVSPIEEFRFSLLGDGLKYFLEFHPLFGEDSHFDFIIFFRWVETNKQSWFSRKWQHILQVTILLEMHPCFTEP